jgi:two-component system, chemotaxis family, response regulator Rcp1
MKALTILVVAENLTDGERLRAMFPESPFPVYLHVVHNGTEALAVLQRTAPYPSMPRPDVIVLDVTVPQSSRQELLAALSKDPQLKSIPVVVLTA